MQADQRSKTADAAAATRAAHRIYDRPVVFDDPYALDLTSPGWRRLCKSRLLHRLIVRNLMADLMPFAGQVLSRARYAEDCLDEAIAGGVEQYVIVGAGLDSFALRRRELLDRLVVFELDHPDTQRAKRRRLAALGHAIPAELEFVPIDFEAEGIADALARSPFSSEKRAFFSWLGTVAYLSDEAVFSTLTGLASAAAVGSEVVLDYAVPWKMLDDADRRTISRLRRFTARRGEPLRSLFEPAVLCEKVEELGYTVLENLTPAEQNRRYFSNRTDGLRTTGASYYLHLAVTG